MTMNSLDHGIEVLSDTNTLALLLRDHCTQSSWEWLERAMEGMAQSPSSRNLFVNYSLLSRHFPNETIVFNEPSSLTVFLEERSTTILELARTLMFQLVLTEDPTLADSVQKITEVADTSELTGFLKLLLLLPDPGQFRDLAVHSLRTNVQPVFDALALDNPYPSLYFETHAWNQMFLKAAFMQRPLHRIVGILERTNHSLARMISDYAHERWAAGRPVDFHIWKAVQPFAHLEPYRTDVIRLLTSGTPQEVSYAASLCQQNGSSCLTELLEQQGIPN